MPTTYSLHKIDNPDTFSFNSADYSRFKFGDDATAEKFGIALAKGFIKQHLTNNLIQQQIVVISSPYAFIPTATFAMKNHFVFEINRWLAANCLPVVQETKVNRMVTYKEDYGELNAEERINLIGNDTFHIDSNFVKDKTLFFLDDIRITGSHEKMITKMLDKHGMKNEIYLLYFAELINKDIHPNIENYLNYFSVKSVFDLNSIIHHERFTINTRIVKYILNTDTAIFTIFMQSHSASFLALLYNMALGNSYHTIEAYQKNLEILGNELVSMEKQRMDSANKKVMATNSIIE